MILNFKRVSIGTQSVTVGGQIEDRDERNNVRIVDSNEFVGLLVFPQMLEFVDYYVDRAASGFLV